MRPIWSVGSADAGSGAAVGAAIGFAFAVARPNLNAIGFSVTCGCAAVFWMQPFEVHRSSMACCGVRQQPTKAAIKAPINSVLTQFTPLPQNPTRTFLKKPHAVGQGRGRSWRQSDKRSKVVIDHHRAREWNGCNWRDNSISKISHPRAAKYTDVRPRDPNVRQTQQRKAVAVRKASPVALTF